MTDRARTPDSEAPYRYSLRLEWEPEGGVWVVTVPEIAGCRTHGATLAEAVKQAQEVIRLCVDSGLKDGKPVPPPKFFDLDGPNPPGWGY